MEPFFPPSLRVGSRGPLKTITPRQECGLNSLRELLSFAVPAGSFPPPPEDFQPGCTPASPRVGWAPEGRDAPASDFRRARAAGGRVRAAGRPSRPRPPEVAQRSAGEADVAVGLEQRTLPGK